MIKELKEKVLRQEPLSKEEAESLIEADLECLCTAADEIRQSYCGDEFDLCAIVNGKSGNCTEDCKFCAQSSHYPTNSATYPLLDSKSLVEDAKRHWENGVYRYSIVTSGRKLNEDELEEVCDRYRRIQADCAIYLCGSHGLLSYQQLCNLKEAGVRRYHCNLETSRRFFPTICTTHNYDDKIATIHAAQKAGLTVCSGGIMGLGETMADRIDLAFALRSLGIRSVPINILNPIPGTPFAHLPRLLDTELQRIVAIYRFILPDAFLRLAGGRELLADQGKAAFQSGANAVITGKMLTTGRTREEIRMGFFS